MTSFLKRQSANFLILFCYLYTKSRQHQHRQLTPTLQLLVGSSPHVPTFLLSKVGPLSWTLGSSFQKSSDGPTRWIGGVRSVTGLRVRLGSVQGTGGPVDAVAKVVLRGGAGVGEGGSRAKSRNVMKPCPSSKKMNMYVNRVQRVMLGSTTALPISRPRSSVVHWHIQRSSSRKPSNWMRTCSVTSPRGWMNVGKGWLGLLGGRLSPDTARVKSSTRRPAVARLESKLGSLPLESTSVEVPVEGLLSRRPSRSSSDEIV